MSLASSNVGVPIPKVRAYIALGSNLGASAEIVAQAMERLQSFSEQPIQKSSLLVSKPVNCPPGSPDFVNAAVALIPYPDETPESLLRKLLAMELEFGPRPRNIPNEPRLLDLDLIAFGNETRDSESLTLPHPLAAQRRFVLEPLAEIAPDFQLSANATVRELLSQLPVNT